MRQSEEVGALAVGRFRASLANPEPPDFGPALAAAWYAEKGDLDRAFSAVAQAEGSDAAWVIAHLHRAAGDLALARLWYGRAQRRMPLIPLELERQGIIAGLLGGAD